MRAGAWQFVSAYVNGAWQLVIIKKARAFHLLAEKGVGDGRSLHIMRAVAWEFVSL
jgi:hypothetical protein